MRDNRASFKETFSYILTLALADSNNGSTNNRLPFLSFFLSTGIYNNPSVNVYYFHFLLYFTNHTTNLKKLTHLSSNWQLTEK